MMTRARLSSVLTILAAALVASCADGGPSGPLEPASRAPLTLGTATQILACPAAEARSASTVIGPLGGTLSVAGNRLSVPPGAVLLPTRFTLTAPATEEVKVEVHAEGVEHYQF